VPNVPKMTMNDPSVPKSYLVYGIPTKILSVPTGVSNLKCAKVNQMYQNSLEMIPICRYRRKRQL